MKLDIGTPERHAKGDLVRDESTQSGGMRARSNRASVIDTYLLRGLLSLDVDEATRMYDAANRLAEDFQESGLQPAVIAQYRDMIAAGGGIRELHLDRKDEAYRRFRRAVEILGNAATVVIGVCCFNEFSGGRMDELRNGLSALAEKMR